MSAIDFTEQVADQANGSKVKPDHHVVVIGAGLSGIGMGKALVELGIEDFVIFERADGVGGTWRQNTYPGVGVDVPAHAYQFSYALNPNWSRAFAKGEEVRAYVEECTDRFGVRPFIRFNTEVLSREWDEQNKFWRLDTGSGVVTAKFVISAIGAFVDPKPAAIPGVEDFKGKVLESANWDHSYDLTGKRVAIIGTGASAVQIIPEIAEKVEHLDVYQRTPIWVSPKPDFKIPAAVQKLFAKVPPTERVVRAITIGGTEFILITVVVNHRLMPYLTKGFAWANKAIWYRIQVNDPVTRKKLTPTYGFGCKRPAVSNKYLKTFNRQDVDLITDPIEKVTASGVLTKTGEERPVDALILATGFNLASDPAVFRRTPVKGRNGFDLAKSYEEQRLSSYEGISMPGLPNHFMMFGPYGWTGGTWHQLVETVSIHISRVIAEADKRGAEAVEVKTGATERWTEFVRERSHKSLWFTNNCHTANSYYFDQHGDTPYLRPTSSGHAWKSARGFSLEDYTFES